MQVIVAGTDRHLRENVARIVDAAGHHCIRTSKFERVVHEVKQLGRVIILDMAWEELAVPGAVKQIVNIARISRNKVVCICPNQDEDLKKLAREAQPTAVFIRYDLYLDFRLFIEAL